MPSRRRSLAGLLAVAGAMLAGCSGSSSYFSFDLFSARRRRRRRRAGDDDRHRPGQGRSDPALSATGNAGIAGQAMRNAAEMALSEFNAPNIQLLVKDDGGSARRRTLAAQQALDEGAQIILGPLFAQSVSSSGRSRARATCRSSRSRPMPMSRRPASIC